MPFFKRIFSRKADNLTRRARVLVLNQRLKDEAEMLRDFKEGWDKKQWQKSRRELIKTIDRLAKERSRKARQLLKARKKAHAARKAGLL